MAAPDHPGAARQLFDRLAPSIPNLRYVPLHDREATAGTLRYAQLPRLIELGIRPALVTITLGWAQLLPLDLGAAPSICASLRRDGDAALGRLRERMESNASLILTTLYDPMAGSRPALRDGVLRFNDTLRELATQHDARIADIEQQLSAPEALSGITPNCQGIARIADALHRACQSAATEERPLVLERTSGLPL